MHCIIKGVATGYGRVDNGRWVNLMVYFYLEVQPHVWHLQSLLLKT